MHYPNLEAQLAASHPTTRAVVRAYLLDRSNELIQQQIFGGPQDYDKKLGSLVIDQLRSKWRSM